MTGPTQAQLDDFERRLQALASELEELKRQAAGPAAVPDWLAELEELFRSGQQRKALREAERLREKALKARSRDQLRELLACLETVSVEDTDALARIRYAASQNIAFLGMQKAAESPAPAERTADVPRDETGRPLPFPVRPYSPRSSESSE